MEFPLSCAPRDIGSHAACNIQIRIRAHAGLAAVYKAQRSNFGVLSGQRPVFNGQSSPTNALVPNTDYRSLTTVSLPAGPLAASAIPTVAATIASIAATAEATATAALGLGARFIHVDGASAEL